MSTCSTKFVAGFPCLIPNKVIEGDGFYVSYNDYDSGIYGCDTTALVGEGNMEHFFILNGDHRKSYMPLIAQGFEACMTYFCQNGVDRNKYSERPGLAEKSSKRL